MRVIIMQCRSTSLSKVSMLLLSAVLSEVWTLTAGRTAERISGTTARWLLRLLLSLLPALVWVWLMIFYDHKVMMNYLRYQY